ncbi:MAG: hypothetical protein HKO62_12215 [Gammaproteobacteria bacterium]|nr:hypothetical protein [Gammaproteobacteria bacterium]
MKPATAKALRREVTRAIGFALVLPARFFINSWFSCKARTHTRMCTLPRGAAESQPACTVPGSRESSRARLEEALRAVPEEQVQQWIGGRYSDQIAAIRTAERYEPLSFVTEVLLLAMTFLVLPAYVLFKLVRAVRSTLARDPRLACRPPGEPGMRAAHGPR